MGLVEIMELTEGWTMKKGKLTAEQLAAHRKEDKNALIWGACFLLLIAVTLLMGGCKGNPPLKFTIPDWNMEITLNSDGTETVRYLSK